MSMGRPKAALVLDTELHEQLESFANSRSLPAGLVRRAKIILLSASGKTNREVETIHQVRSRNDRAGRPLGRRITSLPAQRIVPTPLRLQSRLRIASTRSLDRGSVCGIRGRPVVL